MEEEITLENLPKSQSAKRMLSFVSDGFYDNSYVGKWLFQAMGQEYDTAREVIVNLPEQFFPETATWALMYHELKWGLPVREHLPVEERRRLIYQKRDQKAPMTPYRMELYLKKAVDFDVQVQDIHDQTAENQGKLGHPNVFKVTFTGEGTLNTALAKEILNTIKQSHTVYQLYEIIFTAAEAPIRERVASAAFRTDFYPRNNIPYLMYDGTGKYNRRYKYNGYKTDYTIDLYPTGLTVHTGFKPGPSWMPGIAVKSHVRQEISGDNTRLACLSESSQEVRIQNEIKMKQAAAVMPKYAIHLTIGKHLTRYDGTYRYDGARRYDSEIIQETI